MPPSMRRHAVIEKKPRVRDEDVRSQRVCAVEALRAGESVAEAVRISGDSRATCDRLRAALDCSSSDDTQLCKLLDPASNRAGRPSVLLKGENDLVKKRMNFAASRGFAFTDTTLKFVMSRIACDGRQGYRTQSGLPSNDTVRAWRACNRDMTYRAAVHHDDAGNKTQKREVLYKGTPTMVLTFGDLLEARKARRSTAQEAQEQREHHREERIRVRAESAARKESKKREREVKQAARKAAQAARELDKGSRKRSRPTSAEEPIAKRSCESAASAETDAVASLMAFAQQ